MRTRSFLASAATSVVLASALLVFAADTAQEFGNKAAIGGMFEVESNYVALGKTGGQNVKAFAQKMIDDHSAASVELVIIAAEQQLQVQRHTLTDALTLFASYAQDGDNTTLKTFAAETLPTLKMHQEIAESMASGIDHQLPDTTTSTTPAINSPDTLTPAAPVAEANDFPEGHSRDRTQEAGFYDVTGLTKVSGGVRPSKTERVVPLRSTFRGNVVADTN